MIRPPWARSGCVPGSARAAWGVVYVASADGDAYALRASDGRELWRYATGGSLQSSLAVAGNVVYAGDINGGLWALRAPPSPGFC